MQELNTLFEQLKITNQAGIYLLINESDKSVYINYASNISASLVRLLSSNLFFPKYDFKILEVVTDKINLRPRCQFYKDLYSSNGYNLINPKRVSNWRVVIEPIDEFRVNGRNDYLLTVKLVSGAYKEIIVGIYETYESVNVFLQKYYARNLVTGVIYDNNELLKEYNEFTRSK